jgi:membrane protease YdiL (CAAX protease family)
MFKNILSFLILWELVQLPAMAVWFSDSVSAKIRVVLVVVILFILFLVVINNFLTKIGLSYCEIGVKLPEKSDFKKVILFLFPGTIICLLWFWIYIGVFKIILPGPYIRLATSKSTGYLQFLSEWGAAGGFSGAAVLWCSMLLLAMAEEVAFRGLLLNYIQRGSTFTKAVLYSSALFALVHFNIYNFPVSFGLGVILALLYAKSGGLAVPISVHFAYNLAVIYFGRQLH